MSSYDDKLERRRQRYAERAERARQESDAAYRSASAEIEHIPPGQPILVGHHSERRHRRALARHDSRMRQSVEASERARHYDHKAEAVGTGGISSDDSEAAQKLAAKLARLEAAHERMVAANKCVRAGDRDGLLALGFSEGQMAKLLAPDLCGRVGFPSYALSNSSAEIRRVKARLGELQKNAARESQEIVTEHLTIRHDVEENRVLLIFPGKPSEQVRDICKRNGFRWKPSSRAWSRHLNAGGINAAEWVRRQVEELHARASAAGQSAQ